MIKKALQILGLIFLCFAGYVLVLSLLPEPKWQIDERADGMMWHSRDDAAGNWAEDNIFTKDGKLVTHRYWDWQRKMHTVQYDPDTGDVVSHETRE